MPAISIKSNLLVYKGSSFLRQRLILATLSGKPVRIVDIRSTDDEPGLKEFEVSLIRLLDKITNGTVVELNETGTSVYYQPGLLSGGTFHHDCCLQRGIGYYLEVLLALGIFCKTPLNATLRGVTSNTLDPSVDHLKMSGLATLRRFVLDDEGLDLKICNRGMLPLGGGEVILKCPVYKQLRPLQLTEPGMVKRVRGTAYALRVSPAMANRLVDAAKGTLLNFLPDVYVNVDQCRGRQSGHSPGFGVCLVAETTGGMSYCAERVSDGSAPEELGTAAAHRLLDEVHAGGCVDSASQWLAALFMALGQKDVSKLTVGPLSKHTVAFLQHLREFFGVTFKLERWCGEEDDTLPGADKVLLTCVGIGYTNLNRRNM